MSYAKISSINWTSELVKPSGEFNIKKIRRLLGVWDSVNAVTNKHNQTDLINRLINKHGCET